MSFRYLYDKKSPNSTIDFVKRMLDDFPLRVHSIQTDNGTEFTYRKHLFDTVDPLDIFCKKNYIKRVYSPVASPWYCQRHAQRRCSRKHSQARPKRVL